MVPTSCLTICASGVDGKGQEQQPEPLPGSVLRGWNGILKESWRNTPRSSPSPQMGVAATVVHKLLPALMPQLFPQLHKSGGCADQGQE